MSSVYDPSLQNAWPVFLVTIRVARLCLHEIGTTRCCYYWNQYLHCRVVIRKTNGHSASNTMLRFDYFMDARIYELCVYGGFDDSLQGGTKSQSDDYESVSLIYLFIHVLI